MTALRIIGLAIAAAMAIASPALAAVEGAPHLNGGELHLVWIVPFVGILLSIALFPLLAPEFWHHHFGKVSAFWAAAFLIPFLAVYGLSLTVFEVVYVLLLEYIPFIILLLTLFTVAGGVRLTGRLVGSPVVNTAILLLGTVLASWMGTTGAAMVMAHQIGNTREAALGITGSVNFLLLAGVVGVVLMSGIWKPGIALNVYYVNWELQNIARDVLLLAIAYTSWVVTDRANREANGFTWFPIMAVGKLFAGIFLTIVPAIAILKSGTEGALGGVVSLVTAPDGGPVDVMYFWLTGILSSFLDNAPTYLVFFNTAGGDAAQLMGEMATTLLAISAGAVFMGANTYIGNAPNFMVRAIAEEQNVAMPSFFGYMVWSIGILLPIFFLVTFVFFV